MTDESDQHDNDAEEHRKTYLSIMKASGEVGLPFVLALAVFFISLILENGIFIALFAAVVVYFAVFFIVKTFFSH